MGKVGVFTTTFTNTSRIYYPGQVVQGEVQAQVNKEVKIREIRLEFGGFSHVRWSESHGSGKNRRTVTYSAREDYFNQILRVQIPPDGGDNMMLQPGSYRYPFHFQLPVNSPSSFEGHVGRVRFYVKATMDRPWAFDEDDLQYITVLNLLDLNTIPVASQPQQGEGSKTLCCLCCKSGPISAKNSLPKGGYVPGEAIQINAECINHSNRDCEVFMELIQVVRYMTPRKTRPVSTVIQQTPRRHIGKGDSDFWSGEQLTIPPLPASGLMHCNIIDIQYYWQFVCDPSGPAINLRVPLNIIVGGIPLVTSARLYGAPTPMNTGMNNSMAYPPVFPENIPRPSFASFSTTQQMHTENREQGNAVQPSDDTEMSNFQPSYPYYNWNQYDSSFQPTLMN